MNRRTFLAFVSALVAVPAFIRAKVDEADDECDVFESASVVEPETRSFRAFLLAPDLSLVQTAEILFPGREAIVPVSLGSGGYSSTRFVLSNVSNELRIATYIYSDGPRYWENDFVHWGQS